MNQDIPTTITFASLNLAAPILRALVDKAYTHPSPIQAQGDSRRCWKAAT